MEWGKWVSQFSDCSGEYEYDVGLESIGLELEAEGCISKADLLALIRPELLQDLRLLRCPTSLQATCLSLRQS